MQLQSQRYFGLEGIGSVQAYLPDPLQVSYLLNSAGGDAQEIVSFHCRVFSYMISKEIECLITKNSLKNLRLHKKKYKQKDSGGSIRSDETTMIYLLCKSTNPATRIGVSNLKDEIEKVTLTKFVNNVKYLLDDMYYNCNIIIDKGENNEDYVCHLFRYILSVQTKIYSFI